MLNTAKQKLSTYPQVFWQTARASELPLDNCCFDVRLYVPVRSITFDDPTCFPDRNEAGYQTRWQSRNSRLV